jgi:transposase-like protein
MERRKFTREFKLEAVRLIKDRGVSYVQASRDLGAHPSQLRDWVKKKFSDDPQQTFPGHGQMKPVQLEIGFAIPTQGGSAGASRGSRRLRLESLQLTSDHNATRTFR